MAQKHGLALSKTFAFQDARADLSYRAQLRKVDSVLKLI